MVHEGQARVTLDQREDGHLALTVLTGREVPTGAEACRALLGASRSGKGSER